MTCERHSWFFDSPCPQCVLDQQKWAVVEIIEDKLEIPSFLQRIRIWRDDGMTWVEGQGDVKPGDEWVWAGHRVRALMVDGDLRYRELSYTPPEKSGTARS